MDVSQINHLISLDRSRRRWRLFAVIAVLLLFLSAAGYEQTQKKPNAYVARVDVADMMLHSPYQDKVLADIAADPAAKALVVFVDSPGGTMVAGHTLLHLLRQVAAQKPVAVVMGTVAASAGYMVSLGGDVVIANPATLTGSIGVMMPLVDASELARKIGIKSDEVASGSLKTATSPLKARNQQEQAYLQQTVMDMQDIFIALIKQYRPNVTAETLKLVGDGRIITGQQAKTLGLVDELGTLKTAREWLETKHNISQNTPELQFTLTEPKRWIDEFVSALPLPVFKQYGNVGLVSVMR